MDPATVTGGGFLAAYMLMEIIKMLINKFGDKESPLSESESNAIKAITDDRRSMLTEQERRWVQTLYDMHNVRDEEGRPLWYIPRSMSEQQNKIIELLGDMSVAQKDTAHVLERIVDKLDHQLRK